MIIVFHTSMLIEPGDDKNLLRVISAMFNTEINAGRFQTRRKGFHDYYFFLWQNKNYNSSIDIERYWRNEKFRSFCGKRSKREKWGQLANLT